MTVAIIVGMCSVADAAPWWWQAAPPVRVVEIVCGPTCAISSEPPRGERIELRVRAVATSTLILVSNTPCAAPCRITWPGVDALRVRTGAGSKQFTFAVSTTSPSDISQAMEDPTTHKLSPADFAELAEVASPIADTWKIWGDSSPVRLRVNDFIVNPEPVPQGTSPATDAGIDEYFDDVVLLTGVGRTCTGVVVGERHVLTARHCAGLTTIRANRTATRTSEESFPIVRTVVHPSHDLDAALFVTDRALQLPVRARSTSVASTAATGVVKIVGYGTTDGAKRVGVGTKRQATMAVAEWQCTPARARRTGCVPEHELVIAGPSSDTCSGDSGGPALENVGGRWRLVGITSRGIPTARGVCGGGGIYTSVGAIADWIEREVKTP